MKKIKILLSLILLSGIFIFSSCDPNNLDDTEITVLFDCPDIGANIGDPCIVSPSTNETGFLNANCECEGDPTDFDCPDLMLNIGDVCTYISISSSGDTTLITSIVSNDCECGDPMVFDCPDLQVNIGDDCFVDAAGTIPGTINANCDCEATGNDFDCPDLMLNIGDDCLLNPNSPDYGTVNANCECEDMNTAYDCPDLEANYQDDCFVDAAGTIPGTINVNCECEATGVFDCPDLMLNIGDICTYTYVDSNGNTITMTSIVSDDCECGNNSGYDCPNLLLNIGDDCFLDPAGTMIGTVNSSCECVE